MRTPAAVVPPNILALSFDPPRDNIGVECGVNFWRVKLSRGMSRVEEANAVNFWNREIDRQNYKSALVDFCAAETETRFSLIHFVVLVVE